MVRIGFQSPHSRDFECKMLSVFFNESLYLLDMSFRAPLYKGTLLDEMFYRDFIRLFPPSYHNRGETEH